MLKNKSPSKAICHDIIFHILQDKSPSFLLNKYKLGRIQAGVIILNPFECMYLFMRKKIASENPSLNHVDKILHRLGMTGTFLDIFIVYDLLKSRGFYVKVENQMLYYRRTPRSEFKGPVKVIRESGGIKFRELFENGNCIYAALDDDNDLTIFISESWDQFGKAEENINLNTELKELDNLRVVDADSVPRWFGTPFGDIKLLNRAESGHLKTTTYESHEEFLTQKVYDDLIKRSFIVKTGFKYGANFRIYSENIEEHADFLVHVIGEDEQWFKISRAVRVAQGVRKEMLFSGFIDESPKYIKLRRVKDPFSSEN